MNDFFFTWSKQRSMPPLPVQRSEGDFFVLEDGRRVYDFISTSFQASFGHSQPEIIAAITNQLQHLPIASPKAVFELKNSVSKGLLKMTGLEGGKMFYTVSGAESVENALKMARRIKQKPVILARQRSYHGATLGAMSVSGDWRSQDHLNFTAGTARIPEPDVDPEAKGVREVLEKVGAAQVAGVIVESITGTNGVIIPPRSWFVGLREICDQHNLFLILDEVLSGFYRCQTPFAFQALGGRPDLICMSKAITGGYIPFGAVWVNQEIADFYEDRVLVQGLTNYAHPLGLAATEAVLNIISTADFQRNLKQLERSFAERIGQLAEKFQATAFRCQGMLAAIEFGERELPGWADWAARGCYLYTKGNLMILAPPLVTSDQCLQQAFDSVEQGLSETFS
jgi:taurine--2-oxoglutarate transaminase